MKAALFIVMASLLAAGPVRADAGASFVDGDWIGTGSFQLGDRLLACSEVKMKFVGTATAYEVREASLVCGDDFKQDFTAVDKFAVKEDGQITFEEGSTAKLEKGLKVGSVKDNVLRTLNPIDGGGMDDISLQRAGDFLIYNQVAGTPGKTPDYALVAIMKKAHP